MIQSEKYYEYIDVAYNSNINSLYNTFAKPQDCNATNICNLNPEIISRDCDTTKNCNFRFKLRNCYDGNGFGCDNTNNFVLNIQNTNAKTNKSDDNKKRILENLQCIANQFVKLQNRSTNDL
jgi:hypothetical protein